MMSISQLILAALPWLLLLFTPRGFCDQKVDCQWGPYGDWSDCDGCTKLQTRSRAMVVYAQFGGNPCNGERTETRSCVTTQGCPLEDGCGNRFRCPSGKCISQSLVCNGDRDCKEDGQDERVCEIGIHSMCPHSIVPPYIYLLGLGFDVVSGKWRASVINTESFGGQCRVIYYSLYNALYRLPLSTTKYSFPGNAHNFSDEMYTSKWHYAKDIVNRETVTGTTTGYNSYDFHETDDQNQTQKVLVLKSDIEEVQFQSNSPQYLQISEEFWKALAKLPSVYDYAAYRKVLERFGTHYLSEGSLGGSFEIISTIDEETERQVTVNETDQDNECVRSKRWFLIFPIQHVDCRSDQHQHSSLSARSSSVQKVKVKGGYFQHIAALEAMQLSDPDRNWEMYSKWAESLRLSPVVTKKTLRPLSELVKEVQCAGVKRLYLRRAIEQYLTESDSCHCRPCSNNGMVFMDGDECKCICKPGTSGLACEQGAEVEGQQGVIHGSWACWSAWSSCSGARRSRSRTCSNPAPQNGGQQCIGETTEDSDCEDLDLQNLKTMEPQCFNQTLPASPMCGDPPVLINGYILDPKDIYPVGSKVQYTCTDHYYLVGDSTLECTANQTWSSSPGLCAVSRCHLRSLSDDITASPFKQIYGIGEKVTLSCPAGRELLGEATLTCDSSLHFSSDPAGIKCGPVTTPVTSPPVQCKPWEKSSGGKCVCKTTSECSSSLELCATDPVNRKPVLLNVCKMHAMQCAGKAHTIAENSICKWPERNTTGCTNCHMWEKCDDQTNKCRCRDAADCMTPGLNVCVKFGEDATAASQTMSECEAGLWRCMGDTISVVSILPCTD